MTKAEEALNMLIEKDKNLGKDEPRFYPTRLEYYFTISEKREGNTMIRTFEDGSTLESTFSETNYPGEEVETFTFDGGYLNYLYWGMPW